MPAAAAVIALLPGVLRAQEAEPTVPAVFAEDAPRIDGVLDEPVWSRVAPVTGFVQRVPVDGGAPSERTEVRVAFDEDALYFGLVLHDSDPSAIRRSILHREGRIDQDDRVIIALDTYHDGRNAYIFELNPFGTQGDALITDERMAMSDWNWEGVYRSEGRVTDEGWTLEVAIPFTTIRFSDAERPTMGVAFYRSIRRKNEEVFFPHISQRYGSGIFQVSRYATLTGLENLRRGRYLEVKPFAIAGAQRTPASPDTEVLEDVGLDLKYAVTSNLTLDLTYNTDFAQVEADNVQVNLTRFSLFYPEKREFFLERAGLFTFGDARENEAFFSRRIGLTNEIAGGGRATGQLGRVSLGALSLWTRSAEDPSGARLPGGNSSVVRARADVAPRTTVGGIVTSLETDGAWNRLAGVDLGARFWGSSALAGWWARTWDGEDGGSAAGAASLDLRNDRMGVSAGYTDVAADYDPALGFVRRRDMVRWSGGASFFPRFESSPWARQLVTAVRANTIAGHDGRTQSTDVLWHNMLSFQTGDFVTLNLNRQVERLFEPTRIQGALLPSGDYTFDYASLRVRTNESREFSGSASLRVGDFWNGALTNYGAGGTWKTGPHLTLSLSADRNDVRLPVEGGRFSTTVLGLDVLGAVSRELFANALVQWDDVSETLQANIRIDWIHTPGSDLFLVLDTGYLTGPLLDPRESRWARRTGVVKLTYLKAF